MKARNMALCALFAALLAICSWIALPVGDTVFTLQSFGVFLTLTVLGGKRGFAAILVWLLLGAVGLPVFSGFRGGMGALLDVNGGFLWGFLLAAGIYWLSEIPGWQVAGIAAGLTVCYICGSLWFYFAYFREGSAMGLGFVLLKTVLPYLIPDLCKLFFAWWLAKRLKNHI